MDNISVSAVIVTYKPDLNKLVVLLKILETQVKKIVVVDNSDTLESELPSALTCVNNAILIALGENKGIAYALNVGYRYVIDEGANWVISFDQDSTPPSDLVSRMTNAIGTSNVPIHQIAPYYSMENNNTMVVEDNIEPSMEVITSGSLVSTEAYMTVGGYKDELFIDSVDTEFSWNLFQHGFSVYTYKGVIMDHCLGNKSHDVNLFGKRIMTITNHNYLRYYYMTRNALYISDMYKQAIGQHAVKYRYKGLKILLKVLIFEEDKLRKFKYIIKGYMDYKNHKMGKI